MHVKTENRDTMSGFFLWAGDYTSWLQRPRFPAVSSSDCAAVKLSMPLFYPYFWDISFSGRVSSRCQCIPAGVSLFDHVSPRGLCSPLYTTPPSFHHSYNRDTVSRTSMFSRLVRQSVDSEHPLKNLPVYLGEKSAFPTKEIDKCYLVNRRLPHHELDIYLLIVNPWNDILELISFWRNIGDNALYKARYSTLLSSSKLLTVQWSISILKLVQEIIGNC